MKSRIIGLAIIGMLILSGVLLPAMVSAATVVRPEEIRSMRQVIYDTKTYAKLDTLWKAYFDEYPSEFAYANWMYAARYAGDKNYSGLLDKGLKKYPSNPILLYLKALEHIGAPDDTEGRKNLEKAAEIDPNFIDPWFALVTHYMSGRDDERLDLALRKLLNSGVIYDEVMDFNYNMLISLEKDAILITNGDNDTYPGWILERILKIRADVTIVNRSLLNSEWYPIYMVEHGLPSFIDKKGLMELRDSIFKAMKGQNIPMTPSGPFGDTLIIKIIESAKLAGRPVYFSKTVFLTEKLKNIVQKGMDLGLVILVTPSQKSYSEQLSLVYDKWINEYRTSGLRSWRLRYAPDTDAGRMIMGNYGGAICGNLEALKIITPDMRPKLFQWYLDNVEKILSDDLRSQFEQAWCCSAADIKEIGDWCKSNGITCNNASGK